MIKDFIEGMTAYGTALNHVSKYNLWGYVLLPGLISLLLGLGVFGLAWSLGDNVGDFIDNVWKWNWGRAVVEKASDVIGGLLVLLAGLMIFKQLIMVVTAPLMSILSEKVENQLRGNENGGTKLSLRQIISDILRGLKIAVRNIIRELLLTVFLMVFGLIPLFSPFAAVLIFLLQAYYAGFGNIDFALERHFRFSESVRFVHRHRGLAIGNGVIFLLLLFTFAGFLLALPLGTVAATIETVKRLPKAAS